MQTTFPAESPSFGDHVRIRHLPQTEATGLAGLTGQVYGQTTPSVTSVNVIGEDNSDYAINVFFQDRNESFWFVASLVEFIDHAPGTQITVGAKEFIRSENGEWHGDQVEKKPWWRFWS